MDYFFNDDIALLLFLKQVSVGVSNILFMLEKPTENLENANETGSQIKKIVHRSVNRRMSEAKRRDGGYCRENNG